MGVYVYRALDKDAQVIEGTLEAPNMNRARIRLQRVYPRILSLEESSDREPLMRGLRGVPTEVLAVYTRQLCTMVAAGIPLNRALQCLAAGDHPGLNRVLIRMMRDVDSGHSLHRAMQKYPGAFPVVYTRLVEAGEVSGELEAVLDKLGVLLEKTVKLKKRFIAAFTYPAILGLTSLGVLALFIYYILPMIQPIFLAMGVELPLITRMVLWFAGLLKNPWFMVPATLALVSLAVAGVVFYAQVRSVPAIRLAIDRLIYRIPIIGKLLEKGTVSRLLFTLATLLDSGVTLGPALTVAEKVAGNEIMARRLSQARQAMMDGEGIYESMHHAGVFDRAVLQMIKVGEESGELDRMMRKIALLYEEEVDLALTTLASALEPLVLVVMGVVVAFVTLAAFLPTVTLLNQL